METGKTPFDTRFAQRTATQDAFFPADFTLSSPQGVSKGETGDIPSQDEPLQMTNCVTLDLKPETLNLKPFLARHKV